MSKTFIYLVIDRSGSMAGIKSDAEGAVNAFLQEQAADTSNEAVVSLVQFNTAVDTVFWNAPLSKELTYTLHPGGMTALNDAIGTVIDRVRNEHHADDDKHLLVIVTDGYENSSREWTVAGVKAELEELQKSNWKVEYLASSDIDVEGTASGLGIGSTTTFTGGAGLREAYNTLSATSTTYRSS